MIVIPPIKIDASKLVAADCTIPEPDASQGEIAWVALGTYTTKQVRVTLDNHRKYESQTDHTNSALHPKDDIQNWEDIGATNRHAMFDTGRNAQSIGPAGAVLAASVVPGKRVNALFLGRLAAAYVTVIMVVSGVEVYRKRLALTQRRTRSWSDYYFGEFVQLRSVMLLDLPFYAGATITVELDNGALPARCSSMVVGRSVYIGDVDWGGSSDQILFGGFERDQFGNPKLLDRRALIATSQSLIVPKSQVDKVLDLRTQLNTLPAVYSGMGAKTDDGWAEMFLLYAIHTRFRVIAVNAKEARVDIDIEEF